MIRKNARAEDQPLWGVEVIYFAVREAYEKQAHTPSTHTQTPPCTTSTDRAAPSLPNTNPALTHRVH